MGVPRIKIYQLPPGYTESADTDVQFRKNDELVPFIPKRDKLTDVLASTPLIGVALVSDQPLYRLAYPFVLQTVAVVPSGVGRYYTAEGVDWNAGGNAGGGIGGGVPWKVFDGPYAPVLRDANENVLTASAYTLDSHGIRFTGNTLAETISFYALAGVDDASTRYAFVGGTFYRGANPSWNRLLVRVNDGPLQVIAMPADGVGVVDLGGIVTTPATGVVKASYAVTKLKAQQFISPYPNWIGDHIEQWPDVFVGLYDYPGDQYIDPSGNPIDPKEMPRFRDPGTYQLNFRDGTVTFPEEIDSVATPVRANYARLTGVANVTGQILGAVAGNTEYRAVSESIFPNSHNKRWTGRNDAYTPINIYVDGQKVPVISSAASNEYTLSVKMN